MKSQLWIANKTYNNENFYLSFVLPDGSRLVLSPYGEDEVEFKIVDKDGDVRHDTRPSLNDLTELTKNGFPLAPGELERRFKITKELLED